MTRDFRYLRVTESSTDWLASCILLADGVYTKYIKIKRGNERENEILERKTTRLLALFFFKRLKPTARHHCENHSHVQTKNAYNSYESLLMKKVLIF